MIKCTNCGAGFTREEMISVLHGADCRNCDKGTYETVKKESK